MTVDSSRRPDAAADAALRYAEPMEIWLLLLLLALAGVVVWAWWRIRVSASSSSTQHPGQKQVFETTMGDLRDLRHALRPLQKDRRDHPPG
jgi:type VI protein secretion system component VasF